jgi:hypothetical protein
MVSRLCPVPALPFLALSLQNWKQADEISLHTLHKVSANQILCPLLVSQVEWSPEVTVLWQTRSSMATLVRNQPSHCNSASRGPEHEAAHWGGEGQWRWSVPPCWVQITVKVTQNHSTNDYQLVKRVLCITLGGSEDWEFGCEGVAVGELNPLAHTQGPHIQRLEGSCPVLPRSHGTNVKAWVSSLLVCSLSTTLALFSFRFFATALFQKRMPRVFQG